VWVEMDPYKKTSVTQLKRSRGSGAAGFDRVSGAAVLPKWYCVTV